MGPVATTVQWRENPLIVQGGRQMRLASKGGNRKQETGNDSSFWPRFLVAASTLGYLFPGAVLCPVLSPLRSEGIL